MYFKLTTNIDLIVFFFTTIIYKTDDELCNKNKNS